MADCFGEGENQTSKAFFDGERIKPPATWNSQICMGDDDWEQPLKLNMTGSWIIYQAKLESIVVNGSYCFNSGLFKGGNAIPSINRQSTSPGEGWQEVVVEGFNFPKQKCRHLDLWAFTRRVYADYAKSFGGSGVAEYLGLISLYTYAEDGSNRVENITDWALAQFRAAYGEGVSKRDIFHYVYALLHHPAYRTRYAENLTKSLPRIPLAPLTLGPSP